MTSHTPINETPRQTMPSPIPELRIVEADLSQPDHQAAIVAMMDAYSEDTFGDGKPLAGEVKARLIPGLRAHPTTIVFLAFVDGSPAGIATCFRGFSTFAAKPLINISDYYVVPKFRRQRIGLKLMQAIETKARQVGCCKLTLEVQEHNRRARDIYGRFGFKHTVHVDEAGGALFLSKQL